MRRLIAAVCVIAGSVLVGAAPVDAGGGGCHNPDASEGVGSTVETRGGCFVPSVLRVEPGANVTFVNRDGIGHNLSGVNLGGFDELGADAVVTHHFESVGTYPYACNLHPGMTGAIVVGDGRGGGTAVRVAAPVLAGADRPVTNDPGSDLSPVPFAVGGVLAGLALGFVLRKGRAARA